MAEQQFDHIVHYTTLENFDMIQEQNALLNPFERRNLNVKFTGVSSTPDIDLNDAFPGVYMTALNEYDRGTLLSAYDYDPDAIYLVFSPSLLKRRDWHLNLNDQNGYIDDFTFCAETIDMYPADVGKWFEEVNGYEWVGNELVFHNKVTLQCLSAIWVGSERMKQKVLSRLTFNVAVKVQTRVPELPTKLHPFFIPAPKNMQMKLCFGINVNSLHKKKKYIMQHVKDGLIANCGMASSPALLRKTPEDLNQDLIEHFFTANEATSYPPFIRPRRLRA